MSTSLTDEEVFAAALRVQATPDRMAYLAETCAGNPEQHARVKSLLAALDDAGSFLNKPVADFAALGATVTPAPNGGDDHAQAGPAANIPLDFLTPSDNPDALGKLGPYVVEEVIGRGGMGIVLRAVDPKLNRVVAIKVLAPEFLSHPMAAKRFLREAQAAAAVSHDHVVRIYAVDDVSPVPFLVMECIVGQSLQQKIERKGILEIREILRIGSQIASGLAAAHKQGLVHRDIKPANILLENGIERVKITDFGLARAVDDVGITQSGQVTGTPQYMSPEQAMGEQVDHRSDLFSLGSVLYTMCTGRPAFRATSTVAVLRRVVDDAPRPIRELNPDAPDWLIAVIDRLMAKNPDERFQTAAEVATVLEQWLAHYQRPQTVPAPAFASPVEKTSLVPAAKGALRRAWDEWWSERDRWVAVSVQIVLVVLHLICMLAFLNFYTSRTMAGDKPQFQFWMGSPSPWYRLDINQGDKLGFESGFYPFTWSVLMGLIGWALYYAVWRIEKARDPKASWWNRHEVIMSVWGVLAVGGVVFGTVLGHGLILSHSMAAKTTPAQTSAKTKAEEWQQLFNHKDQSGWITHPDQPTNGWHIVDGNLVGRGNATSHIFTKRDNFRDFHLRAEVKINAGGNGGIFLRAPFAMMERIPGSKNPLGYEVQITGAVDADPTKTYLSGGILPLANPSKNLVQPDKWFTLDVVAQGNRLVTAIDGLGVVDVTDPNQLFVSGHLALQTWGSETEIALRRIEVRELSASEPFPLLSAPAKSSPGTIVLPDPVPVGKGKQSYIDFAVANNKLNNSTAIATFDLEKLEPTAPGWATGDVASFENGALRIENDTNHGNFNVLLATILENIPQDGLVVFRAKVKVEAKHKFTWGDLQLGDKSPDMHAYDWPESMYTYRGNVPDWTQKEIRYPAKVFHEKNPPQIPVYVGLHANGVLWLKDLELLHLPGEIPKPVSPAGSQVPKQGIDVNGDKDSRPPTAGQAEIPAAKPTAVLEELRKQVDLTAQALQLAEAHYKAGQSTKLNIMSVRRDWILARLRLAEATGGAPTTSHALAQELVQLLDERVEMVRTHVETGLVQATELSAAAKELSEARIRLLETQPDNPCPPSLPE